MYAEVRDRAESAQLLFEPVRSGVFSWNTYAKSGIIAFRLLRAHRPATDWLNYAEWNPSGQRSFSSEHDGVRTDIDVIRADQPFDGIEVRAPGVHFNLAAFSSEGTTRPSLPYMENPIALDVPTRSQYVGEDRGWCSPASLSMIHAYYGVDIPVSETAKRVFDREYNGTGNWALNVAASGHLGFHAVAAYLENLDQAHRFMARGIPLVISYGWKEGELPGAPISHSDGHLAVLRGFTSTGDCAMNDPAYPAVRTTYPRNALERLWQRAGALAYIIAPAEKPFADLLTNA